MITIEYDPRQVKSLLKALNKLDVRHLIMPELKVVGKSVIKVIEPYPPPVATSKRTGYLGKQWFDVLGKDSLRLGNAAIFAGYVVGEEQRDYHKRHGWKNLIDVIGDEMKGFMEKVGKRADKIWSKR